MSFKFLLKLCLLCSTAFCFQFKKDCVSKRHFETDRIATSWDIRVWAPRENTDARILTLVSQNEARSSLRKIDITRTEVHTLFIQGSHRAKNTSSIPGDGFPPGWREFRVTSDSRFKVWATGVEAPLVDVEDDVGAERVVVRGSNVTINCREPIVIWNVTEDRETAVPLGGPGRYDLAVFSRSPSSPVVTLGDRTRVLSWDPDLNMVTTFASQPRALPAFVQHNFTIECSQAENHFRCDVLAGQNETLVGSASLPDEIDELSIHGNQAENFIVILRDITSEEATAGDSNSSLEEADGPPDDWLNEALLSYSPIVSNFLLVVVVAVLYVKNKKLKMVNEALRRQLPDIKEKIQEPSVWRYLFWEFLNLFKNGRRRRSGISQPPKIPEKNPLNPSDEGRDEGAAKDYCGGDAD
ncbi:uncharacterized protein LOC125039662 isoform X2 [Penaeus chinensis]|uniref:uncharacterized protein LOC125039662 isoform X2 n=1 Tax=Penaeus chinensis TaxID=139456 RepID=UPI001FB83A5F|nr:uncharacterized protein LOC125039662 isoform X2 [Penaeus chinensis]